MYNCVMEMESLVLLMISIGSVLGAMAWDKLFCTPRNIASSTMSIKRLVKLESKTEGHASGIEWGAALEMGL